MDPIKEAFSKAKQDISELKNHISQISQDVLEIKRTLSELTLLSTDKQTNQQTNSIQIPFATPQPPALPTDNLPLNGLKRQNNGVSIGNRGVPTNKQTNQQANQQTHNSSKIEQMEQVTKLLESLDTIKKELRTKFKYLTKQEMLVFSTLYQLEEEGFVVDYSKIAVKLFLSESSIRDYIQRIIAKGIPIQKTKENNKKILLSVSSELKKLASLQTILTLREI